MKTLIQLRQEIDTIDVEILKLVAKRLSIVEKIGKIKKQTGTPVIDTTRKQQALKHRLNIGLKFGLTSNVVTKVYNLLHDIAVEKER